MVASLVVSCVNTCFADTLVRSDSREAVTVISFDRQDIQYRHCSDGSVTLARWADVSGILLHRGCRTSRAVLPDPRLETCNQNGLDVFAVTFRGRVRPVIAENAALTAQGLFHMDLFDPWVQAHGPAGAVESVSRQSICRDQSLKVEAFPSGWCHEPRTIAVAFDYNHPFDNQILTNGFSFSIKVIGKQPPGFDLKQATEQVRSAFQFGISAWASGLAAHDEILTPAARRFIASRTATSNSFKLLTPPQVVSLKCPENATFSVALVFHDPQLFPKYPLELARARIEGQTIALNMGGIPCFQTELRFDADRQPVFETSKGCVNLIPVLTHELGHAFGLRHADNALEHSLMDSQLSRDALAPTVSDLRALVLTLSRSIEGAKPGELEFVSSSGVMPPADWIPGTASNAVQHQSTAP
jgi:Matrixin